MKDVVFLEYLFLFEPSTTWAHLNQFEADLNSYFEGIGIQAQVVKTVGGQTGRRILMLSRKDRMAMQGTQEDVKKQGRPTSLKTQIHALSERKLRAPAIQFMNKGR